MLDLAKIDLDGIGEAMEDNSYESSWWFDPTSGQVEYCSEEEDSEEFEERDLLCIHPIGSHEAYGDMEDFVELVRAERPRDLLERAIQGRGAFRRFKDTVCEFPELEGEWNRFRDMRMRRRAMDWLSDQGIVHADAVTAMDVDEPATIGLPGPSAAVATALRRMYGDRLVTGVVFGSRARGESTDDSDLDLLVVLRDPVSPWEELRRMDDMLWDLSMEHGLTVSALPVGEEQWRTGPEPVLVEARVHGIPVS